MEGQNENAEVNSHVQDSVSVTPPAYYPNNPKQLRQAIFKEAAYKLLNEIQAFVDEEQQQFEAVRASPDYTGRPGISADYAFSTVLNSFKNRFGEKPRSMTKIIAEELNIDENDHDLNQAFSFSSSQDNQTHSGVLMRISVSVKYLKTLTNNLNPIYEMLQKRQM